MIIGFLEVAERLKIVGWMPKLDLKKIRLGIRMKASPQVLPDGKVTAILESA